MVHGVAITEPIWVRTKAVAKALAAELALKVLEDESSDYHLSRLCDCSAKGNGERHVVDAEGDNEQEKDFGIGGEGPAEGSVQRDETEEGFAVLAQQLVETREGRLSKAEVHSGESSDMDISEDEAGVQ